MTIECSALADTLTTLSRIREALAGSTWRLRCVPELLLCLSILADTKWPVDIDAEVGVKSSL
jgi:hypothetical protein